MGILNLLKNRKKTIHIVDKTQVHRRYIEYKFQFLVDSGYKYKYYQKNSEMEFVYTLKDCCVELFVDGCYFDCVIKTGDIPRSNVTQNPLVDTYFKERFARAINIERIDMAVDLINKNADIFLTKKAKEKL